MARSFWLLLSGQAVSALGDAFGTIAMGWLVYDLTGSKLAMGTLYVASLVPEILALLGGGPLIDRLSRSRLMAWSDVIRCAAYALPPALAATGHLALWHLYLLSAVAGAAGGLFSPALMALLPSLVPDKQVMRANALFNGAWQLMALIGPGLAGVVIAAFGSRIALTIDAASFGISALTLLWIPGAPGVPVKSSGRYVDQLSEGFRFFKRNRVLLLLMLLVSVYNLCVTAVLTMVIPFVREQLAAGAELVGGLQSAVAVGFLIGTLVLTWLGDRPHRRTILLGSMTVAGVLLAAFAFTKPGQAMVVLMLAAGVGVMQAAFITTSSAIFQKMVADSIRGRVMAVRMLIVQGVSPVGALLGAMLSNAASLPAMFLAAGILPAVLAGAAFGVPLFRQLDGAALPTTDVA